MMMLRCALCYTSSCDGCDFFICYHQLDTRRNASTACAVRMVINMRKHKHLKIIFVVLLLIIMVMIMVSNKPEKVHAEGGDWVSIVALTPNHYDNYTDPVTFTATIRYNLDSADQGIIYLGFNTDEPDFYTVDKEESDHVVVQRGSGTVTLTRTVTPVNWDSGVSYMYQFMNGNSVLIKDFQVYANISEYPHDMPWTPLAIDEAIVTNVPEYVLVTDIPYIENGQLFTETVDTSIEAVVSELDSDQYSPELAHLLIALCNTVHNKDSMERTLINMDYTDHAAEYDMDGILLAYCIARKQLSDGTEIVLIVTRGTDFGNLTEVFSNLHIGLSGNRHRGFSDAEKELMEDLVSFLGTDDFSGKRFVLTGHSRGAAVINLLAADLIDGGVDKADLYAYTFACPDVEKMTDDKAESDRYDSIFNIGNANDFVTWVPDVIFDPPTRESGSEYWNKYGRSYWFANDWDNENELLQRLPASFSAIADRLGTYHSQRLYMEYLYDEKNLDEYRNRTDTIAAIDSAVRSREEKRRAESEAAAEAAFDKFMNEYRVDRVSVFCPVDISILDKDGNRLAYTVDDIPYIENGGEEYVSLYSEEDRKRFFLTGMDSYTVMINGRSEGTMLFESRTSYDGENFEEQVRGYENVRIEDGKTFLWEINTEESPEDAKLMVVDPEIRETAIAEVQPDGTETELIPEPEPEPVTEEVAGDAIGEESPERMVIADADEDAGEEEDGEIPSAAASERGRINIRFIIILAEVLLALIALTVWLIILERKEDQDSNFSS